MSIEKNVTAHYSRDNLADTILEAVRKTAPNPDALTPQDLQYSDNFHVGGIRATEHLAQMMKPEKGARILDIGAGIGGPARYIAKEYRCRVDALDLTPDFIEAAHRLNEATAMTAHVFPLTGSALDMPYEDACFDAAYMMHVGMNIEDKASLYHEAFRTLKSGGHFYVYDIMKTAEDSELMFPVPWADTSATSFLVTKDTNVKLLEDAGFKIETTEDRRDFALKALEKIREHRHKNPLAQNDKEAAQQKFTRLEDNVKAGNCQPWIISAAKP